MQCGVQAFLRNDNIHDKTPLCTDFGTKQNTTVDCEICRLRGLSQAQRKVLKLGGAEPHRYWLTAQLTLGLNSFADSIFGQHFG